MTKQEFIQQYRVSMRAQTRRLSILAVITVVIMAPALILAPRIIEYLGEMDYFNWAISFNEYSLWGYFGCLALALAFASRRVTQPYGVSCQTCGQKIAGTSARLALITGNCGFCGEKVLDADTSADAFKSMQAYD